MYLHTDQHYVKDPAMTLDLLTIIVGSVSCGAFCLVMVTLLVVLYRKEPLCCKFRPQHEDYQEEVFQYCSNQSLISHVHSTCPALVHTAAGPQPPGGLFVVGKPPHYHLPGPPPRLPSYDSVRKRDRQRHIHSLIAQRFGLGLHLESPPSYEESVRDSLDMSTVDLYSLDLERSMETYDQQHSELDQDDHRTSSSALYTDSQRAL